MHFAYSASLCYSRLPLPCPDGLASTHSGVLRQNTILALCTDQLVPEILFRIQENLHCRLRINFDKKIGNSSVRTLSARNQKSHNTLLASTCSAKIHLLHEQRCFSCAAATPPPRESWSCNNSSRCGSRQAYTLTS